MAVGDKDTAVLFSVQEASNPHLSEEIPEHHCMLE